MTTYFIALSSTYEGIEVAFFEDSTCLTKKFLHKNEASKLLMPTVDTILQTSSHSLHDLSFIAINRGPGPFTTLRVAIASVNGLSFATGIPLVGVNGLEALLAEIPHARRGKGKKMVTIALLNAFAKDVYYGVAHENGEVLKSDYMNISLLLNTLHVHYKAEDICFIGNGTVMYQQEIRSLFGETVTLDLAHEFVSLETIAKRALEKFKTTLDREYRVMPLYLKQFSATMPK